MVANFTLLCKFNNVARWFLGIRHSKRIDSFKKWLASRWIKRNICSSQTWFDSYNLLVSNYNYTKTFNSSIRIFGGKNSLLTKSSYIEELYIFDNKNSLLNPKVNFFNFFNKFTLFWRVLNITEMKRKWTYYRFMRKWYFTKRNFLKYGIKPWYYKKSFVTIDFIFLCLIGHLYMLLVLTLSVLWNTFYILNMLRILQR